MLIVIAALPALLPLLGRHFEFVFLVVRERVGMPKAGGGGGFN